MDRQIRKLRNKEMVMVKVQWQNHEIEECTWESEQSMKDKYPHPDEVHSTCNCKGAYVHQVSL